MSSNITIYNDETLKEAIKLLGEGKLIVFPTETVYGIAADATNDDAVEALYKIKRRDQNKPLQILIQDAITARSYGIFNMRADILTQYYWPGPLTLILRKQPDSIISRNINKSGVDTYGLRVPDHPIPLEIIKLFKAPLAATSANLSGDKGAINAEEARKAVGKNVSLIIDGGSSTAGIGSTVLDISTDNPKLLREGSITREMMELHIGSID